VCQIRTVDKGNKKTNLTTGIIIEAFPDTLFKVERDDTKENILAYLAGKMRKFRIRVLVGDKVEVEIDPYGGKGRIVRRL